MKDFMGRELSVGDEVVYVDGKGQGAFLSIAIVDGFTPKMVNIIKLRVNQYRYWFPKKYGDPYFKHEDKVKIGPYLRMELARVTPIKIIKVAHTGEHYGT